MSVIACKISDGVITIASDSQFVRDYTRIEDSIKYSKLIQKYGIIMGTVGSVEEGALFQLFCMNHAPDHSDKSGILSFLSEFADWKKRKTENYRIENRYLLAFKGKCFEIIDWSISEVTEYDALGAGQDFALTALHLGHTAREAVEIACKLCVYCSLPVVEFSMNCE